MGTKKKFDYEQIEAAAKATATNEAFCTAVGIALTSFYHFKNSDPEFSAAFNRGRGREEGDPLLARLTAEDFHGFGVQRLRPFQIAHAAGTNVIGINQHFKRFPELRRAYDKGARGLRLEDDLSTASELENNRRENAGQTDFEKNQISQNSALGLLHEKIKTALESSDRTIHQLTDEAGADPMTVYNALSKMSADGAVEKYYADGAIAFYRLKPAEAVAAALAPVAPLTPVRTAVSARKRMPDTDVTEIERQRVFRAVAAGCNLSKKICMETGVPVGVVMEILDAAEGEEIVVRREPNFIAYFLKEDAPKAADKLILNGKGGVDIVRADATNSENDSSSAASTAFASDVAKIVARAAKTVRWGNQPIGTANGRARGARSGIVYSEEMFEQFGRENLTKKAMGAVLGVGITAISYQLTTKPRLKEAYERGKNTVAAPPVKDAEDDPDGSGMPRRLLVSPNCGRCGDEMIAQHFEDKVVSWYCSDCWEQWDKELIIEDSSAKEK